MVRINEIESLKPFKRETRPASSVSFLAHWRRGLRARGVMEGSAEGSELTEASSSEKTRTPFVRTATSRSTRIRIACRTGTDAKLPARACSADRITVVAWTSALTSAAILGVSRAAAMYGPSTLATAPAADSKPAIEAATLRGSAIVDPVIGSWEDHGGGGDLGCLR